MIILQVMKSPVEKKMHNCIYKFVFSLEYIIKYLLHLWSQSDSFPLYKDATEN